LFRICESESIMTKTLAPEVRSEFAKRLKDMRQQKGFPRARYFAKTLGIEENRYTRYERAEVEPSLTLIHKMCEVLQVTPNQLLGFPRRQPQPPPGFSEDEADGLGSIENLSERQVEPQAWRLASAIAAVRSTHGGVRPADPLALMGETSKLFQQMLRDPFNTVANLVAEESVQMLEPERKAEIARLVRAFTDAATDGVTSGAPRR
jgi:transcriptional regulator with XRE-family HTH domain